MRLLFLSHRLPCPPHKGEKIRALNVLAFLARRHEVHLASLVDDRKDLSYDSMLRPHVRSLTVQQLNPRADKVLAMAALLGPHSVTTGYFYSRRLQRKIDELIDRERIEAVFCSSSPMAEYVFRSRHAEQLRAVTKVMDLIDIDSVKWRHYAEESNPLSTWVYRREARCLAALEERVGREFDRMLVVTEAERSCCPIGMDRERVTVMSNGVDLEYFSPSRVQTRVPTDATLVFTGVMDYRPNVDGVLWFVHHILSRIRQVVPNVRFLVVGNNPTRTIRALDGTDGITVTGFVPDVREYLAMATVCIAPLRIARGIQNKVLEAMAMGRPVVATPQAFDGIDATPGRDLLVSENEGEFAAHVVGLLEDPLRAARIGGSARVRMEQRYSWPANLRLLDELLPTDRSAHPVASSSGSGLGALSVA